jgi:hypothetical protein
MITEGTVEVKLRFCNEKTLKTNFIHAIENIINEPSPIAIMIIKRFIKLLQLVTQTPQTFNVILIVA